MAGTGIEPISTGHEPVEIPLLYPANIRSRDVIHYKKHNQQITNKKSYNP